MTIMILNVILISSLFNSGAYKCLWNEITFLSFIDEFIYTYDECMLYVLWYLIFCVPSQN